MHRSISALAVLFALVSPMAVAQAAAQSPAKPQPQSRAEIIAACMKEAQAAVRTGPKSTMTPMQRMTAEEQCRARAEAAEQSQAQGKR
ncbi:hypothetical protein [Ferrovibrio sp.]|uniref:hypothetical protein n=1 Tax=Ferrovibrio sp. TaxID=1917215 RepID=UPI00262BB317|nr:hypothetical protein [Ferrovibrio sp.]